MTQPDITTVQDSTENPMKGKYLIFSIDQELFGIEIQFITEIIGLLPITIIPDMPSYIRGISNLRGKIIPMMDARLRFQKKEAEYSERTCIIVLDINGDVFGLIVDAVTEVTDLDENSISLPPEVSKQSNRYIQGIGQLNKSIVLLLDCQKIISDDDMDLIREVN